MGTWKSHEQVDGAFEAVEGVVEVVEEAVDGEWMHVVEQEVAVVAAEEIVENGEAREAREE